jgi:hypothetical protein
MAGQLLKSEFVRERQSKRGGPDLAGAEESGDDGGGDAGVQRLRVKGSVGEVPSEDGGRRPREGRLEASGAPGEGIERAVEKNGGGCRSSGRPVEQQPCRRSRHAGPSGSFAAAVGFFWGRFLGFIRESPPPVKCVMCVFF